MARIPLNSTGVRKDDGVAREPSRPRPEGLASPGRAGATPLATRGFHFYRGEEKFIVRGMAYGPFRPNGRGVPYPEEERAAADFAAMAEAGVNVVRMYSLPDETLAARAADAGLSLLLDIPWPTHLDVYSNPELQRGCLDAVSEGLAQVKDWPNLIGVFLGNEIRPDLVRWAGERRVRGFLRRLYARAKAVAPEVLVGFANYPSTEYVNLDIFDFIGFNIYLEDPARFREYLTRLRHLYPEKPLLVSECGLDSLRSSEARQAEFLEESLTAAYETGAAGAVVFSWTDEWHTGGHDVEGWAFGIVGADRHPKGALEAVRRVFLAAPQVPPLASPPRFSVIIATYNGGATLRECLRSVQALRYPNYETILVDDGSTDGTGAIVADFPDVRVVRQENHGLSAARNAGIAVATGDLVAFTDSDCYVDRDWLHHLAVAFENTSHSGLGGPNLTPREDGPWQRAVALAPGHATHVLLNFNEAEHVPGCNMAFRRSALDEIGGFDPQFRKAGDDVDLVWRLRDQGRTVGFCPAAFVWHHRRATLKAYWKQHMGYGEAEGLLVVKHPHRFNDRGESIWRGAIYPGDEIEPLFGGANVRYGIFASGGYQCVYEKRGGGWPHFFTSLEWWALCVGLLILGIFAKVALAAGLAGIAVTLSISAIRAFRKWNRERRESAWLLLPVWLLWITQPLARAASRYRTRLGLGPLSDSVGSPGALDDSEPAPSASSLAGRTRYLEYWGESGAERLDVLRAFVEKLTRLRWIHFANSEWESWDLSIVVSWWYKALVTSACENHGGSKRLLRLRFRLAPTGLFRLLCLAAGVLSLCLAFYSLLLARYLLVGFLLVAWVLYRRARARRIRLVRLADEAAREAGFVAMGLVSAKNCSTRHEPSAAPSLSSPAESSPPAPAQARNPGR